MLTIWNGCKLSVKLQASFALVMVIFAAAIVGILCVNAKVAAVNAVVHDRLSPSRVAILRTELFARSADDDGAYYIRGRDPAKAAAYLASYRDDITQYDSEFSTAAKLAVNDVQRSALAERSTSA
jgi:hypothetical protein